MFERRSMGSITLVWLCLQRNFEALGTRFKSSVLGKITAFSQTMVIASFTTNVRSLIPSVCAAFRITCWLTGRSVEVLNQWLGEMVRKPKLFELDSSVQNQENLPRDVVKHQVIMLHAAIIGMFLFELFVHPPKSFHYFRGYFHSLFVLLLCLSVNNSVTEPYHRDCKRIHAEARTTANN